MALGFVFGAQTRVARRLPPPPRGEVSGKHVASGGEGTQGRGGNGIILFEAFELQLTMPKSEE